MRFTHGVFAALWAGMMLLTGCSSGVEEFSDTLVPVTGTVSINGQPASNVALMFIPQDGTPGTGGYAVSDDSGKFTVTHRTRKAGIEAGKYKITFSRFTMPDGSPIPEGKNLADVEGIQTIPENYSNPDQTEETAEVSDQPAALEFDLKFKG